MSCQINITLQDWLQIKQCEALILQEYERNGTRFARAVAWGDLNEMEDQASMTNLCIIPTGVSLICQKVLLVKDIMEPLPNENAEIPEP